MSKLLLITQAVDPADSALGFFCEWIEEMSRDPRVTSIDVWCLRKGDWIAPANVGVIVFPPKHRLWWFLQRLITSRFDGVFVHMSPIWVVLGGWWWRLTKQRVVLWYTHGTASKTLRIAMKLANVICTATKEAFPIKSDKVMAIGHGISPCFAAATPASPVVGKMELISVGRITQRKRVKETIEFFSLIRAKRPDAHLTWIGEPLTDADRAYAAEIGSPFAVTFTGKKRFDELPSLYANANALLHLSATGSLDKVVIEALAAGCPVFSTNHATREAIPGAFWDGTLDQRAAEEVIRRAEKGMTMEERQEIATRFSLVTLIKKIVDQLS